MNHGFGQQEFKPMPVAIQWKRHPRITNDSIDSDNQFGWRLREFASINLPLKKVLGALFSRSVPKLIDPCCLCRFPFDCKTGDATAVPFRMGGDALGQSLEFVVAEEFYLRKTAARLCGRSGSMIVIDLL